jgi:subtilisin family serine protease
VSGAGNDGGTSPVYPAAYDRVLAVASTGRDDTRLESSNFGSWVDVAAPGSDVRTCFRGGGYRSQSGTSVAAAIVSGLAGLLRCQNHDLSPGVVRAQIMRTADPICREQPGCTPGLGSGRINASRALVTDAPSSLAYYSQTTDGRSGFEEERGSTVSWQAGMHNGRSDATSVCATLSTKGPHLTFSQCW